MNRLRNCSILHASQRHHLRGRKNSLLCRVLTRDCNARLYSMHGLVCLCVGCPAYWITHATVVLPTELGNQPTTISAPDHQSIAALTCIHGRCSLIGYYVIHQLTNLPLYATYQPFSLHCKKVAYDESLAFTCSCPLHSTILSD